MVHRHILLGYFPMLSRGAGLAANSREKLHQHPSLFSRPRDIEYVNRCRCLVHAIAHDLEPADEQV